MTVTLKTLLFGLYMILIGCDQKSTERQSSQKANTHLQEKAARVMPADFAFIITDDVDSIHSKDASLTRRYMNTDSCVTFPLSQKELEKIYQAYLTSGLDKLDTNYYSYLSCHLTAIPSFDVKLTLISDGKARHYKYNHTFECTDKDSGNYVRQVERFLQVVWNIVNSKEAVKKLPGTDLVFE